MYGQGYDGASNMAGKFNGVQVVIRATHSKALYVYCAAHSFNLAVCTKSDIKSARNCLVIVEQFNVFFNTLKRKNELNIVTPYLVLTLGHLKGNALQGGSKNMIH